MRLYDMLPTSGSLVAFMNCAVASGSRGLTGHAISKQLTAHGGVTLSIADYIYSNAAAAHRALHRIGSTTVETCVKRKLLAALRHDYSDVGHADAMPPKSVHAGAEARATEIAVPITDHGKRRKFFEDDCYAREGRVIIQVSQATNVAFFFSSCVTDDEWMATLTATKQAAKPPQ